MYKLYTDKQETFECDLFLEGADLKQSSARIVVESNDLTLMFKGEIDDKGNCKVPIKKLKGLMSENTTGNIKLEVIAEDTLIEPWQSDFIVDDGVGYKRRKERLDDLFKDEDKKKRFIHLICRIKGEKVYDDKVEVQDIDVKVEDAELVVETIVKKVKLEIKENV